MLPNQSQIDSFSVTPSLFPPPPSSSRKKRKRLTPPSSLFLRPLQSSGPFCPLLTPIRPLYPLRPFVLPCLLRPPLHRNYQLCLFLSRTCWSTWCMYGTNLLFWGRAEVLCIWLHIRSDDQPPAHHFDKKLATQSFLMKNASSNPSPALLCQPLCTFSSGVYGHVTEEGTDLFFVNLCLPSHRASNRHVTEGETDV